MSKQNPYGKSYQSQRRNLLADFPSCVWCLKPATTADHVPPLAAFPPGEWEGQLVPACQKCNSGHRAMKVLERIPQVSSDSLRIRRW